MQGGRAPVLIGVAQRSVRPGRSARRGAAARGRLGSAGAARGRGARGGRGRRRSARRHGTPSTRSASSTPSAGTRRTGRASSPSVSAPTRAASSRRASAARRRSCSPNHVARAIARGEIDVALVGGTHVIRSLRLARAKGVHLELPLGGEGAPVAITESKPGSSRARGPLRPRRSPSRSTRCSRTRCARAAASSLEEHARRMGRLMEPFTRVAAANPHAWFPVARSADELVKATRREPHDRVPVPEVPERGDRDRPGRRALDRARRTPRAASAWRAERRVYWWGGGHAVEEPWFASERPDFADCPALAARGRRRARRGAASRVGDARAPRSLQLLPGRGRARAARRSASPRTIRAGSP